MPLKFIIFTVKRWEEKLRLVDLVYGFHFPCCKIYNSCIFFKDVSLTLNSVKPS